MSSHASRSTPSFEACNQFFGIAELLDIFLGQCSPSVLLNCTLVCRTWNDKITSSTLLQEHLFLKPVEAHEGARPILNPMLAYFAPILVRKSTSDDASTFADPKYAKPKDLTAVPWARDTSMDAPTRQAFARPEASWRNMLVSQPPISRIDWYAASGWGHQLRGGDIVTLGMLWDLVESRMARGCSAHVQFFLHGMAVENDPDATEREYELVAENNRIYTSSQPRIVVRTRQVWIRVPWAHAGFDAKGRLWVSMRSERGEHYEGDGFNILRSECQYDLQEKRWSKSNGFRWVELDGESSGS